MYLIADHLSQTTHKPVFAAVSRWLFHVTETHQPDPHTRPARPLFALDELANLARLADLPQVLSTIRSRAQVICGIQERSQLEAGWGQANAKTLVGNCPVKLQLPGSSDASALRDWAILAGDDDDDSDADQAASWRTIPKGHARVIADEHPAFQVKMVDPDRWLATTVPSAEEDDDPSVGADEEDGRPYNDGGEGAPDERPPANVFDPPGTEPMEEEVAALVAVGNEAAAAAETGEYHTPPPADFAGEGAPHEEPPLPEEPPMEDWTGPVTDTVADEARPSARTVSAGNIARPPASTQPREAAALNGQPASSEVRQLPTVWVADDDDTAGLWEATLRAEREADGGGGGLRVYYGDDGKRYAVHPFGHTYGLDDHDGEGL